MQTGCCDRYYRPELVLLDTRKPQILIRHVRNRGGRYLNGREGPAGCKVVVVSVARVAICDHLQVTLKLWGENVPIGRCSQRVCTCVWHMGIERGLIVCANAQEWAHMLVGEKYRTLIWRLFEWKIRLLKPKPT